MAKHLESNAADFSKLADLVSPYQAPGRTDSAALLIWFLEVIFRLDEVEAQDAVCDRKADAGIDAIAVKEDQKEIVLFQAKRKQKLPATLGDTDLKEFVGSLKQFQSESSVRRLMADTANDELRKLLQDHNVPEKIGKGYTIRPVFVCNIAANHDAVRYLKHAADYNMDLWDLSRLGPVLKQLGREWFIDETIRLSLCPSKFFVDGPKTNPRLVYSAIKAKELVKMPGIDDTRVFAQNVRLGLGNTRVNNEIEETVSKKDEHGTFLTFHNGLTIVSKTIAIRGRRLTLSGFSVCNGCQSLLTFYRNRKKLTEELELLVRVVRVGDDRKLPELIAYRTNNQNAISLRDLSANDVGQVRLQAEFDDLYGHKSCYIIKRGEENSGPPLHNEYAGRLLLATYGRMPWSCHQKYRVFGDLEGRIFSYDTDASRIRLAQILDELVESVMDQIKIARIQKYGLTKFVVLYLVTEIIREESDGRQVLSNPKLCLSNRDGPNPKEQILVGLTKKLAEFVVTEVNFFFDEHGGENYDYKTEMKSEKDVNRIRTEILKAYVKDKRLGRMSTFALA